MQRILFAVSLAFSLCVHAVSNGDPVVVAATGVGFSIRVGAGTSQFCFGTTSATNCPAGAKLVAGMKGSVLQTTLVGSELWLKVNWVNGPQGGWSVATNPASPYMAVLGYDSSPHPASEFPEAIWLTGFASRYELSTRSSATIDGIVIHTTDGTCTSTKSWFQQDPFTPGQFGSMAQYLVCQDGTIYQFARELDIAYHAGNYAYNSATIGIEHEQYSNSIITPLQYAASVRLVRYLAQKYGIALVHPSGIQPATPSPSVGLIGHVQVPDPDNPTLGGGASHHSDPVNWDWPSYMSLVTGTGSPVNGACGSANGTTVASIPTTNLCSAGTASAVTGVGPWSWTCNGTNGGSTASCSALKQAETTKPTISAFTVSPSQVTLGQSFTINYTVSDSGGSGLNRVHLRRTSGDGTANDPGWVDVATNAATGNGPVNGSFSDLPPSTGTYWYGLAVYDNANNGGDERQAGLGPLSRTVTLAAINGACGSANGTTVASIPTTNLCSAGTASTVTGTGPWSWTCSGSNGGTTANCSAQKTATATFSLSVYSKLDGSSSTGVQVAITPADNNGSTTLVTPSTVSTAATYNVGTMVTMTYPATLASGAAFAGWEGTTCNQANRVCAVTMDLHRGIVALYVTPTVTNGVCGSANGTTMASIPTTNLCSAGTASTVTGTGPWSWTCSGSNGGTTASCSAQKTATDTQAPSAPSVLAAAVSTTQINLSWTQSTDNVGVTGYDIYRDTGPIATVSATTFSYPDTGRAAGTFYSYRVIARDAAGNSSTAGTASATTPTVTNGVCGSANGTTVASIPTANLCSAGTASTVTGTGPWSWTCSGSNGGTTASCSAQKTATVPNDNFANRTPLSGANVSVVGSNLTATKEAGEPNHAGNAGGKSVWWSWTAPNTGSVTVSTAGSSFDTTLGVYVGNGVASLTLIADDDDGAPNLTSLVTFMAVSGTTYQIAVDGFDGASGSVALQLTQSVPITDGACGPANGVAVAVTPSLNLCSTGTASAVAGAGPWSWTCNGSNGGTNATCSAPKAMTPAQKNIAPLLMLLMD